ncbi:carbohydrate ABC transporter permease [bacterium]|nr:carbohydrate ABC transporter permease [bacterium]
MRKSRFDFWFDIVIYVVLGLVLFIIAYPLYFVTIASLSDPIEVTSGRVMFYPIKFNFDSYKKVLEYKEIWIGYRNTIIYTTGYTFLSVAITLMAGYALSYKKLLGRNIIMAYMVFTMFFSGGLIPTYLLVRSLRLIGNPIVIIVLGSVNVYNIIIARTFIQSTIPNELFEAASMDGCGHIRFFFSVVLPLSPALIAVMVLFAAVTQWNSWFNAMIYLNRRELMPLQMVLRDIIVSQATFLKEMAVDILGEDFAREALLAETMKYAVIIVASLPILALYPFLQKYFVKGIMIGSLKQ